MGTSSQQSATSTVPASPSEEASEEASGSGLDKDETFHVLRNQRRRFAIHHLKQDSEPVEIGELATQVAAWENDVSVEEVTSTQRRRVYNALKQTHVPELDQSGLVDVDRREIELTEQAEQLDIYLELVPEKDIQWSEYYLGLAGVGVAAVVVTGVDLGPFAMLPDISMGVFLVVALLVSAVTHHYHQNASRVGGDEKPPELRGD